MSLKQSTVRCPYCWETIPVSIDPAMEGQSYVEDCSVCCHPILLTVSRGEDEELEVTGAKEND